MYSSCASPLNAPLRGIGGAPPTQCPHSMKLHLPLLLLHALLGSSFAAYTDQDGTRTYTGSGNTNINLTNMPGISVLVFDMNASGSNYFNSGNQSFAGDVTIGNTETTQGLIINNGYAGQTITFSGNISGNGSILKTGAPPKGMSLHFSGNMENFTGNMEVDGNSGIILGNASTSLICNAATYNFSNLALQGDTTFSGSGSIGNLSGNTATLSLTSTANLSLEGTIRLSQAISNAGSVSFGSNVVLDLSALTPQNQVYTIVSGGNLSGFTSLSEESNITGYEDFGTTLTFQPDGTISITKDSNLRTWSGGALTWQIGSLFDGNESYSNGDFVLFSGVSEVVLGTNIDTGGINITEGAEVSLRGNGNTLSNNGRLIINGTLSLQDSALASPAEAEGSGTLSIQGSEVQLDTFSTASTATLMLEVAPQAALVLNGGSTHFYNTSAIQEHGSISLENSATLLLDLNGRAGTITATMETLTLANNSTFLLGFSTGGKSFQVDNLQVSGNTTFGARNTGDCGIITIGKLVSEGSGNTLVLASGVPTSKHNIFHLNGGSFSGTIELSSSDGGTASLRRPVMNISAESVAANAVLNFSETAAKPTQFGLGIGAQLVQLGGIDTTLDNTDSLTIFSGAWSQSSNRPYTSDSTVRTIQLMSPQGCDYSTNALLLENLNLLKSGEGTQRFTGDLSAMNGSIQVQAGLLELSSAGAAGTISLAEGCTIIITEGWLLGNEKTLEVKGNATMGNPLMLQVGTLQLQGTLSLDDHPLTLDATDKTTLVLDTPSLGEQVLFSNVSALEGSTLSADSVLGDFFVVDDPNLAASSIVFDNNELKIIISNADTLYWEGNSGSSWDSVSWSATDGSSARLSNFSPGKKAVLSGAAQDTTILVNAATEAAALTVQQGNYVLSGSGSLSVAGNILVEEGKLTLGVPTEATMLQAENAGAVRLQETATFERISGGQIEAQAALNLQAGASTTEQLSSTGGLSLGATATLAVEGMLSIGGSIALAGDDGTASTPIITAGSLTLLSELMEWDVSPLMQKQAGKSLLLQLAQGSNSPALSINGTGMSSTSTDGGLYTYTLAWSNNGTMLSLITTVLQNEWIGDIWTNAASWSMGFAPTAEGEAAFLGNGNAIVNLGGASPRAGTLTVESPEKDYTLVNGSLSINSMQLNSGAFTIAPSAQLFAGQLNGESGTLGGTITIYGSGGDFSGTYSRATVQVEGGTQRLAPAEGLTIAGGEGTIQLYYDTDAQMDAMRLTGANVVLERTTGSTLSLSDTSSIRGGSLTFLMSGEELGSNIILGTLNMQESTLFLGADASTSLLDVRGYGDTVLAVVGSGETSSTQVQLQGPVFRKYFRAAKVENGVVTARRNNGYVQEMLGAHTPNGKAGASLLNDVFISQNPQYSHPGSILATLLNAVDKQELDDRTAAAIAGAGTAMLGAALNGDVQRQLHSIRNRTSTMGVDQMVEHPDMPYFNAWIQGEYDYAELSSDGTYSGYRRNRWGGTLGCDADFTPEWVAGLAFTAMQGDSDARSADDAQGELESYYLSLFARYAARAWTHTFVATVGQAEAKLHRTVRFGEGLYHSTGRTDGKAFGFLYEFGRVFALDEHAETCLQPMANIALRHSSLDAYKEHGNEASLHVDARSMTSLDLGLGARLQSIVGESIYNRSAVLELRALLKGTLGDRRAESVVRFLNADKHATLHSTKVGALGMELGAGLAVPISQSAGSLFLDVSAELRSHTSQINATVGYRLPF